MLKDNLKAFREARGISQEQLAQKLHVVRQTVSKWERGSSVPDADMVVTLAAVFDTDVSTLLGETPNTERPVEALAIQSTLDAQNAAQLARTWRWAKAGFAILGALCICLILTTGLFARDLLPPIRWRAGWLQAARHLRADGKLGSRKVRHRASPLLRRAKRRWLRWLLAIKRLLERRPHDGHRTRRRRRAV